MREIDNQSFMCNDHSDRFRINIANIDIEEPYKHISGGTLVKNAGAAFSPDPLLSYRFDDVSAGNELRVFFAYPVKYETEDNNSFLNLESLLSGDTDLTVKGDGTVMIDFGSEFAAWLEIMSPDLGDPENIVLSVSEYTSPEIVNRGVQSSKKTRHPVKVSDTVYRLVLNPELYEGVRFGFIHIQGLKKEFHITGVRLVCQVKPVNYYGSFECDNRMLNRIWYTAAYDVRVNLKKDYMSAILIDRGDRHSWTGDAYTAQAASLAAFANYDFVLENLKHTSAHPNGIESFELYWLLSLADYYDFSGDNVGVLSLIDEAVKRLEHANEIFDKNYPLSFFGWDERLGAGFENPDIPENRLSYKFLSIECFKKYADIFNLLGRQDYARRCTRYAEEKGILLSSDPLWHKSCGIHAFADSVNAGVADGKVREELFKKFFNDRTNRISYSPFNEFFILKALAKTGKYDDALSSILDLWGSQIEYGGTCFFEVFRPGWKDEIDKNGPLPNSQAGYTSLAHPWSAGVLAFLSTEVLGIKPVKPGFEKFSVIPHLGTQLKNVIGDMPTPHGTIRASFDIKKGIHHVSVPEGTEALVAIPKAGMRISNIELNGSPATFDKEDDDFCYYENISAGEYTFSAAYTGRVKTYRAPMFCYPASFKGIDRDANEKYGSDGFFDCSSMVKSKLPEYVEDIVLSRGIYIKNGGSETYGTNYDNVCAQSFTADIKMKRKQKYTVALRFTANAPDCCLAVEMFDAKSLNLIAPVKILKDYCGGAYMVYEYDRSARFRIDHVRGDYISLGSILFGKQKAVE